MATAKQIAWRKKFAAMAKAGTLKNPIARKRIPAKTYVARKSQITGKPPTKRLKARRAANVAKPKAGYFPNPGATLAIHINAGNDRNGNPRRGWMVIEINGSKVTRKGFVIEGFAGERSLSEAGFSGIAAIGVFDISPTGYKELQKTWPAL